MSSRQNRTESSFAKLAVGAAVGALLGLAAYGVKKVYDEYEDSKQRCRQEGAYGQSGSQSAKQVCKVDDEEDDADYPSRSLASTSATESSRSQLKCQDEPLQVQLDHYHKNYCKVPAWEMDHAREVVDDVKETVLNFMHEHLKEFRVEALRDTGSTEEGLKVIKADEFDVLLHLDLDPSIWMVKEAEAADGYWGVVQKDGDPQGKFADLCIGQYLIPSLVVNRVQSLLERMVNVVPFTYQVCNAGPALTLSITYSVHGRTKMLAINLIPAFNQKTVWVVAKPHPRAAIIRGYENFWRQCYAREEFQHLKRNPSLPTSSCHLKCLQIMKAVRMNHYSQLMALSSYGMKTVLMHMIDQEDDWTDQVLSERIFDFLLALKQYLTARELPNYFCPEMNLLEGIRPETCDAMRSFIIKQLDQGLADMLKTDY